MCLVTTFAIPHTPVGAVNSIIAHSCDGKRRKSSCFVDFASDRSPTARGSALYCLSDLLLGTPSDSSVSNSDVAPQQNARTNETSLQKQQDDLYKNSVQTWEKQTFRSGKQRRNRQRRTPNKRHAFHSKRLERNRHRCIVTSLIGCLTAAFFI